MELQSNINTRIGFDNYINDQFKKNPFAISWRRKNMNKLFSMINLLEETHSKCCDAIIVNGRCFNCKNNVE